ncbi:MAG: DinB family protein [Acidobacteria bacterium]|nr:DinB family protein [Acidobacteriota bacterium]
MTLGGVRRMFILALMCAALAACGGAPQSGEGPTADTPAGPGAAAGGATVLGDLLKDWQEQKDTMLKIADAMPEDGFGYKSTPPQRSYGEQVMHVALVNVDLLKLVGGTAAPPSFTAESVKTKADMLKALAESYDYGTALLNAQTDASVRETIDAGFLGPSTRARVFWFLLGHSMDVYGQMVVYLRLNGIVPPASRGL